MPCRHLLPMLVVPIDNPNPALPEKHPFAGHIFLKGTMLIRADMIWFKICKNPYVK